MAYGGICSCWSTGTKCEACVAMLRSQLGGGAQCRGDAWAVRVARAVGVRGIQENEWPDTPKARALARKQVIDFDRDDRLASAFARLAYHAAKRRWNELQRDPDWIRRSTAVTWPKKKG
jgi:hypothetical protein